MGDTELQHVSNSRVETISDRQIGMLVICAND